MSRWSIKKLVATPEDDEVKQNAKKLESFDEVVLPSNWLRFFFEFLRSTELASDNPKSTCEELTTIIANEGIGGRLLLQDRFTRRKEKKEESKEKSREKLEERQRLFTQRISLRFPTAAPYFVKKLSRAKDESYAKSRRRSFLPLPLSTSLRKRSKRSNPLADVVV